ncbi:kinase-like domain-containing protein [Rhizophagus irregularis DAOM 181602=DAOM 197198]|nr:kinase-like domain-containing protein [Rhizophagus irregularis DAOM 181602=DAOM 197198]
MESISEIAVSHKVYGITQNPETKDYVIILDNDICLECEYTCNAIHFRRNFENWTSGNNDIDEFVKNTQLSVHKVNETSYAIEWIPYDRLYDIYNEEFGKMRRGNWIDGHISISENSSSKLSDNWDNNNQNWKRENQNMFVILKILNNPASITLELINKIAVPFKAYGITQNPKSKNYMRSVHKNNDILQYAVEWIPYDRLNNIKYIVEDVEFGKLYKANWIDGYIQHWSDVNKNWRREGQNMRVFLKILNNSASITLEFINKIVVPNEVYGITQDPKTKNYIVVLKDIHKKYNSVYNSKRFRQNFKNWTSALKSLNNSKNVTLEFMNEITLHYKVNLHKSVIKLYGITQDPKEKNYIMVLDYAEHGNLRNYLDTNYNELKWNDKINYLHSIAHGLKVIHEKKLIHRDLHIEEIKKTLSQWLKESSDLLYVSDLSNYTKMQKQIKGADKINNSSSSNSKSSTNLGVSYKAHSEAIYTSRLLNYNNLPEPKNSDDYYEENDNIISVKFSESLQIDISQLKNNNFLELKNYKKNDNINMEPSNNSNYSYEKSDNMINMNSSESLQVDISQLNIHQDEQNNKSKGKEKI